MKLFLYGHGGSRNHGCEAIVRSTSGIFADDSIIVYSYKPEQDRQYGADQVCQLLDTSAVAHKRFTPEFLRAYLALKLKGNPQPLDLLRECNILTSVPRDSIAFSVGGDNYCYPGWEQYIPYLLRLKKAGYKTVFWGCSVEPSSINQEMATHLAKYNLITARESISFEALKAVNPNTVLAPDPAFALTRKPGKYPQGLGNKPYIGINVSPLIQRRETVENITIENYRALIRHILSTTDRDIALIPHVVWDGNDDRIPLGQLYEEFQDSGRVYLVEDQNCMQLKDIISGCEFFIGARTHSTIAAYSTCVPTLVVGYSVKARGIAKDLFGTEEGYVLPVQQLQKKENLPHAFSQLYEKKSEIKKHLLGMMPAYIQNIQLAKEAVERL